MKEEFNVCDVPGPCWDGYVYIGDKPRTKGSCISKENLCKKKTGKGIECKKKIKCDSNKIDNKKKDVLDKKEIDKYNKCLIDAKKRYKNKSLQLCPDGYCSAKHKFDVYPSAYANGYASAVCKGTKPNYLNITKSDKDYLKKIKKGPVKKKDNSLKRWYKEQWVNVCEKGNGPGGYAICGSGKGIKNPKKYPYCRAYYNLPGTKVVTAPELTKAEIKSMCKKKRSMEQGIKGKPTRITLPKDTRRRISAKRDKKESENVMVKIPNNVKKEAKLGLKLINAGFKGGTETGFKRATQLSKNDKINISDLADMRTWFARHGPDAVNGGTSYPGYCKWINDGKPKNKDFNLYRGAVSWLIWGGDEAYLWLKSSNIRKLLKSNFPNRKLASTKNNLI